jgi:RHS repeat-associated protein
MPLSELRADQSTGNDPNGSQLWADLTSANAMQTRYLSGDGADQWLARIDSTGTYWLLTDHLGSIRDVMNSSGTVIDHINYDAFGLITSETNSANGGRLKYAGYESDSALGLYHAGARYYDPVSHRWLREDPLGFAAGDSNLDRYVGNGPTNGVDPSGTELVAYSKNSAQAMQQWLAGKQSEIGSNGPGIETTAYEASSGRYVFIPKDYGKAYKALEDAKQAGDNWTVNSLEAMLTVGIDREVYWQENSDQGAFQRGGVRHDFVIADTNLDLGEKALINKVEGKEYYSIPADMGQVADEAMNVVSGFSRATGYLNSEEGNAHFNLGAMKTLAEPILLARDLENLAMDSLVPGAARSESESMSMGGLSNASNQGLVATVSYLIDMLGNGATFGLKGLTDSFSHGLDTGDWSSFAQNAGGVTANVVTALGAAAAGAALETGPALLDSAESFFGRNSRPKLAAEAGVAVEMEQRGPGAVAPSTPTPKVKVASDWLIDPVRKVGIRTGLYDSETGTVHVGGGEGHRSLARSAGIGEKPGANISGLEIVQGEKGISFRVRSGWYGDRILTPAEQEAVGKALESQFGKPVTYDPNLGQVDRPGGAP